LIRSNISTIINFKLLDDELKINKINYGGGRVLTLSWIDKLSGVIDNTFFGLNFVSGTSIIFSKKCASRLLKEKNKINYELVDDVAIGVFMRDILKEMPTNIQNGEAFIDVTSKSIKKITNQSKYIFYRNKNETRITDVNNMKRIVNII